MLLTSPLATRDSTRRGNLLTDKMVFEGRMNLNMANLQARRMAGKRWKR
jgi:hypothetical protein